MSVSQNTVELWRRSIQWRVILICAIGSTILAFAAAKQTSPFTATSGQVGSSTVTGNQPLPATVASNTALQQCGPQGQLSLQAPIVVSSTGQVPSNVQSAAGTALSPGGIPATVLSHFRQFFTQVDSANLEQRLGERCVRMQGSLDTLEASDYAYADCFQDGEKKLVAARSCAGDFDASEIRFRRLLAAYDASTGDTSASKVEELARARKGMLPFDETRERWGLSDTSVTAGDAAIATLADSDRRISNLKVLGPLDSSSPTSLSRLATAGGQLTALDRSRLPAQSREILASADAAKLQIQESDRRLSAVGEAMLGAPSIDSARRANLIAALSALTDLDLLRMSPTQNATIETARKTAAEFALSDLISAVAKIDVSTAQPEVLEHIRDLASAARRYGNLEAAGVDAENALALADLAANRLEQSRQHISDLHETVATIEAGGPSALGEGVLRVFDTLSDFDKARMSDGDRHEFTKLSEAREIILASNEGKLTRGVPIYLRTDSTEELPTIALSDVKKALEDQGFTIVDALERAAIDMQLELSEDVRKTVKISNTTINTSQIGITIRARWIVGGKPIVIPSVQGSAAGSDFNSLSREAVSNAANSVATEIAKLVGH